MVENEKERERIKQLIELLSRVEESEFTRADVTFHYRVVEKIEWLKKKLYEEVV